MINIVDGFIDGFQRKAVELMNNVNEISSQFTNVFISFICIFMNHRQKQ